MLFDHCTFLAVRSCVTDLDILGNLRTYRMSYLSNMRHIYTLGSSIQCCPHGKHWLPCGCWYGFDVHAVAMQHKLTLHPCCTNPTMAML